MPREYDFMTRNQLSKLISADREVDADLISDADNDLREACCGTLNLLWPQFEAKEPFFKEGVGTQLNEAFNWLSANIQNGGFLWTESTMSNSGHGADTYVWIERKPEQEQFLAAFPSLFNYKPDCNLKSDEIASFAKLKGFFNNIAVAPEQIADWIEGRIEQDPAPLPTYKATKALTHTS